MGDGQQSDGAAQLHPRQASRQVGSYRSVVMEWIPCQQEFLNNIV